MGLLGRRWRRLDRGEMVGSRSRVRLYGGASGTPLRVRLPRGMGLRWAVRPVGQALGRGQLGFTGRGCSLARRTLDPLLFRPAGSRGPSLDREFGAQAAQLAGRGKTRLDHKIKPNQTKAKARGPYCKITGDFPPHALAPDLKPGAQLQISTQGGNLTLLLLLPGASSAGRFRELLPKTRSRSPSPAAGFHPLEEAQPI
jgi:hypothetical protein